MGKLFVFAIGGSGSRVVKALTCLLAAGVEIKADEVVPIIIDPDRANGDMNRTLDLLQKYQQIHARIQNKTQCDFFQTKITTLRDLAQRNDPSITLNHDCRFEFSGTEQDRFRDFIDVGSLDRSNKALIQLLFSEENLDTDMDVGFKGNPNIGSVVLNQFTRLNEFKHFASNFDEKDRIFVVSSIFGGTGAAGFPLLVKNFREARLDLPNHAFLRNAKIGALTILPYFGVEPTSNAISKIDKATFVSKAKAALSYYSRNVSGNRSVNVLYYLGDPGGKDYRNVEGAAEQRNDAHLIELAGALAMIDFAEMDDSTLETKDGKATAPVYKEFGLKVDSATVSFQQLGSGSTLRIADNLSRYRFFVEYLEKQLPQALGTQPWTSHDSVKYTRSFLAGRFFNDELRSINSHIKEWLDEMARNRRSFAPFDIAPGSHDPFDTVIGYPPKRSRMPFSKEGYVLFDDTLNELVGKVHSASPEERLLCLFSQATKAISKRKLQFS